MDMQVQLSAYGHHIGNNLKDLEAFMDKNLEGRCYVLLCCILRVGRQGVGCNPAKAMLLVLANSAAPDRAASSAARHIFLLMQ